LKTWLRPPVWYDELMMLLLLLMMMMMMIINASVKGEHI